jgi:hypothetical protein
MRSLKDRAGTGWNRSQAQSRPPPCCGPPALWPCFATIPSCRLTWRTPSPRPRAGCCPPRSPTACRPGRANGFSTLAANGANGIRQAGRFDEPEQWRFDWEQFCTRDEYLDGPPTGGFYTRLPPDKIEQLLADTGAAIDAAGGRVTVRYTTTVVTATRTATT